MATFNWMVNQILISTFAAHCGQNRELEGEREEKWEVGRVKVMDV